jgi:hypothetical protein
MCLSSSTAPSVTRKMKGIEPPDFDSISVAWKHEASEKWLHFFFPD